MRGMRPAHTLAILLWVGASLLPLGGCRGCGTGPGGGDIPIVLLPQIPGDPYSIGVSAPFCGVVGGTLLVAGGANFPGLPLTEGGGKKSYPDIWALDMDGEREWRHAGLLPDSTAYGATFSLPGELILAGGNTRGRTSPRVLSLTLEGGSAVLRELPSLPFPVEQAAAVLLDGRPLLVGGMDGGEGLTSVLARRDDGTWEKVSDLPEPLVQPVAAAYGGTLFVWGGYNPSALRCPDRGYRLDLRSGEWDDCAAVPGGGTLVGSGCVSLPGGRLVVVGGVDRTIFERALQNTPAQKAEYLSHDPTWYRFRSDILLFEPSTSRWDIVGRCPPSALAGPGVADLGGEIIVYGGELKPGVRTPRAFTFRVRAK